MNTRALNITPLPRDLNFPPAIFVSSLWTALTVALTRAASMLQSLVRETDEDQYKVTMVVTYKQELPWCAFNVKLTMRLF